MISVTQTCSLHMAIFDMLRRSEQVCQWDDALQAQQSVCFVCSKMSVLLLRVLDNKLKSPTDFLNQHSQPADGWKDVSTTQRFNDFAEIDEKSFRFIYVREMSFCNVAIYDHNFWAIFSTFIPFFSCSPFVFHFQRIGFHVTMGKEANTRPAFLIYTSPPEAPFWLRGVGAGA